MNYITEAEATLAGLVNVMGPLRSKRQKRWGENTIKFMRDRGVECELVSIEDGSKNKDSDVTLSVWRDRNYKKRERQEPF